VLCCFKVAAHAEWPEKANLLKTRKQAVKFECKKALENIDFVLNILCTAYFVTSSVTAFETGIWAK